MNPVVNGSWIPSSHCTPIRPSLLLQCIRAVIIVVLELTQVALLCTPYTFSHSLGPQALHLNLREIIVALSFKPCCPRLACPLLKGPRARSPFSACPGGGTSSTCFLR